MKVQKTVDVESPSRRWEVIWALHGMDGRERIRAELGFFSCVCWWPHGLVALAWPLHGNLSYGVMRICMDWVGNGQFFSPCFFSVPRTQMLLLDVVDDGMEREVQPNVL
jgi:hypothetical protein